MIGRTRRPRIEHGPGPDGPARIAVVVGLQHQVDAVLVDQRLEGVAHPGVVAIRVDREQGEVQEQRRPAVGVVRQKPVQPAHHLGPHGLVAVEQGRIDRDQAQPLIVDGPGRLLQLLDARRAGFRQGVLTPPLRVQHRAAPILMIARRRHLRRLGVEEAAGGEPFAPLVVAIVPVDQVPGVNDEGGVPGLAEGHPHGARRLAEDVVLHVPHIEEGEGLGRRRRRAELQPFRPPRAVADAVGIDRLRLQPLQHRRMIGRPKLRRLADGDGRIIRDSGCTDRLLDEVGAVLSLGVFDEADDARRGAPGDRHLVRRIGGQVQDDPFRLLGRRRHGPVRSLDRGGFGTQRTLRRLRHRLSAQGRQRGPEHQGVGRFHAPLPDQKT